MKLVSVNPFTEEVNEEFETLTPEACDARVEKARQAFREWKELPVAGRAEHIARAAAVLRQKKKDLGTIITREMGKPIKQAVSEIEKCAWLCDYYAENAQDLLRSEPVETEGAKSSVVFEPLGVILGIMPWNFPFWQVFRFAIPAMAAGNVCLLKHASNVPMTALELERFFNEAGFPPHVFQTLLIESKSVGQLIEADRVDGVSLTGSVQAGAQTGSTAGRCIKKLVLELGGSDPFLVLDDADIAEAARMGVLSRTVNGGQSCIAAKRFIVMESVAREFEEKFVESLNALKVGDPMEEDTDIGPMAKREFVEGLASQLSDAVEKGGRVVYGQKPPQGKGFFFQPAVVLDVTPDMRIVTEEVFGPIAPILIARDEADIVRMANATEFGLGVSLWSRDTERAERLSSRIQAGFVAVNDIVKSDPRLPFGGVKKSGLGRELSHYGLKEFVNIKTLVVKRS